MSRLQEKKLFEAVKTTKNQNKQNQLKHEASLLVRRAAVPFPDIFRFNETRLIYLLGESKYIVVRQQLRQQYKIKHQPTCADDKSCCMKK